MYKIRKKYKFERAHQLHTAFSDSCRKTIHGHSYIVELFFKDKSLNDDDMVVDFGKIDSLVGEYINSWDHALVMSNLMDPYYLEMLTKFNKKLIITPYNPTAEAMAKDMYSHILNLLANKDVPNISSLRLHETDTGYAEYGRDV
jgi:6-pyruvoyltetrahydropterin/6-carboxytetrahydropterin synthase